MTTRTEQQLLQQAKRLLMYCYESENSINLYGYPPQPTTHPDYLRAKRAALKTCKKYNDVELYNTIKAL